jgi:hypothetical protein
MHRLISLIVRAKGYRTYAIGVAMVVSGLSLLSSGQTAEGLQALLSGLGMMGLRAAMPGTPVS